MKKQEESIRITRCQKRPVFAKHIENEEMVDAAPDRLAGILWDAKATAK